jgi:predicted  nucleic acid-binding Zn-ribbon protein
LQGMGSGDKRWKTENINIMLGEECLKPEDYKVQVVDKGVEINIDVDISGSVGGLESAMKEAQDEAKRLDEEMRKAQDEAKRLDEEMRKAQDEAKWLDEEMRKAQDEAKRLDEEMRKALDEAKHLDEEMRKAQDEAARLQAELDRLQGMGSGDKRWKTENVNVMVGEECLKPADYKVQVVDKGAEINIDVDISSSRTKELEGAMERAQDEAKRLRDEMRKAQEECDKLAAELARLKGMGSGGKRWKQETVTVVMGDKKLSKEEYKVEVLDKGAQIDIDVQIQGIGSKIEDELEAVKKNLLDEESSHLIKSNIKEVLQHLENIAEVVKPKSSQAGQSSQAGPSKRDGDIGGQN